MEVFLNRADLLLHSVNSANLFKNGGMNWSQFKGRLLPVTYSCFSPTHKIGSIGIIANFVFADMMLVDMNLDTSGCNRIEF